MGYDPMKGGVSDIEQIRAHLAGLDYLRDLIKLQHLWSPSRRNAHSFPSPDYRVKFDPEEAEQGKAFMAIAQSEEDARTLLRRR